LVTGGLGAVVGFGLMWANDRWKEAERLRDAVEPGSVAAIIVRHTDDVEIHGNTFDPCPSKLAPTDEKLKLPNGQMVEVVEVIGETCEAPK
jgi:hypothetical protein